MRRIAIWASGLLASAIPFIFIGAVIAFAACVFDAVHEPTARFNPLFQAEAAPPEQALAVVSTDASNDVAQRRSSKHAHAVARQRHAGSHSRSHPRVRHSSVTYQWGPALYWSY
jgi:hypothetical protein